MEKTTRELTVPTQEMGGALIDAALEKRRKQVTDRCVDAVNNLLGLVEHTKEKIRQEQENLRYYERKVEAIEKGEITFDYAGTMTFNDPELKKARPHGE